MTELDLTAIRTQLNKIKSEQIANYKYTAFEKKFDDIEIVGTYSNDELMLRHTILHACFVAGKHSSIPLNVIKSLHKEYGMEMKKRGMKHKMFDALDENE